LAKIILHIIKTKEFKEMGQVAQIYHYSNKGKCSWHEFAKEIFKIVEVSCKVNPIATQQYPTPANRPMNTIMSTDKIIQKFNINIIPWQESLARCLSI